MRGPDHGGIRLLRALLLAISSVGLGWMGHADVAGAQTTTLVPVTFAGVLALSWVATARQAGWSVIALILAGGQALTHLSLAAHIGPLEHAHAPAPTSVPTVASVDAAMIGAHVGLWLALTIVFTVGERALWHSVHRLMRPSATSPMPVRARLASWVSTAPRPALTLTNAHERAPPVL